MGGVEIKRLRLAKKEALIRGIAGFAILVAAGFIGGCSPINLPSYVPRAPRPVSARGRPERGRIAVASWYGPGFNGKRTASGEIFDEDRLTAASRTLPLGSRVRVVDLSTGRSVIVRINDRGPFVHGRNIDLSRAAAARIGLRRAGVARVRVRPLMRSKRRRALRHAITYRRRRFRYHSRYMGGDYHDSRRIIADPVGTWLLSSLPRF